MSALPSGDVRRMPTKSVAYVSEVRGICQRSPWQMPAKSMTNAKEVSFDAKVFVYLDKSSHGKGDNAREQDEDKEMAVAKHLLQAAGNKPGQHQ